jgi:hypothetical protein
MTTKPQYMVRRVAVHEHLSKQGLTVSDLAAELGVTSDAGYQYLKPYRRLNSKTRQKLMRTKALRGLPFDEMFERVREQPQEPPMSPTTTLTVTLDCWEPGNGTRYDLGLVPLPKAQRLLCWPNGPGTGVCVVLQDSGYLSRSYMAEKLGLDHDSRDLTAVLAWLATQGYEVS